MLLLCCVDSFRADSGCCGTLLLQSTVFPNEASSHCFNSSHIFDVAMSHCYISGNNSNVEMLHRHIVRRSWLPQGSADTLKSVLDCNDALSRHSKPKES